MTITLRPGQSMLDVVTAGNSACPDCCGSLGRWGRARWRVVRGPDGQSGFRPDRVRCRVCGVTHVVLPAEVLVRRRDASVVVGWAWRSAAAGIGSRRVARALGVPMETVRNWLRRLRVLARAGPDPGPYGGDRGSTPMQRALAAVVEQAARAGWTDEADLWRYVAYRSQGRLLCNTSWPWPAPLVAPMS